MNDPYFSLKIAIKNMINIEDHELKNFVKLCHTKKIKKKALLSEAGKPIQDVFFIVSGFIRVVINDFEGNEHTQHFGLENEFIADYNAFLTGNISQQNLQAMEDTLIVVIPRKAIEWGYLNILEGEKLGRLIAEHYFVYLDTRIQHLYKLSPIERYRLMNSIFPNIHNRVPQHMIASYIGITPVHLSRLKKEDI